MNKKDLRKVKWQIALRYFLKGKEIARSEAENMKFINEGLYDKLEKVAVYEEGYFHKWIVKYYGNSHEGIYTDEYGLIEKKNGAITYLDAKDVIFIDEFENTVFNNLRQLVGQALLKNNFEDVLEFIRILSTNELIQKHIGDIAQGFDNGTLEQIFKITEELFDTLGNEEGLKVVIDKYGL